MESGWQKPDVSCFAGNHELPPHEQGSHLLRQFVAQIPDHGDPLDIGNFRINPRRLRGETQEIEEIFLAYLEPVVELGRAEPLPCREALHAIRIGDGTVLVFHIRERQGESIPPSRVEETVVEADRQYAAGKDQFARLVDRFPEIGKEKDRCGVKYRVEGLMKIDLKLLSVPAAQV